MGLTCKCWVIYHTVFPGRSLQTLAAWRLTAHLTWHPLFDVRSPNQKRRGSIADHTIKAWGSLCLRNFSVSATTVKRSRLATFNTSLVPMWITIVWGQVRPERSLLMRHGIPPIFAPPTPSQETWAPVNLSARKCCLLLSTHDLKQRQNKRDTKQANVEYWL